MNMTPFALSGLLAFLFSLGFGFVVLVKSPNRALAKRWFLMALSVAVWGFFEWRIGVATIGPRALLGWRLGFGLGVVWIPSFFLHFVCVFLGETRPKAIAINYAISAVFACLVPTHYFYNGTFEAFPNLFFPTHYSPVFIPYFIWWTLLVVYTHWILWLGYKRASPSQKNQILYFSLATSIGYSGGTLVYLVHFGLLLYPYGNFTIFLYPIIMTYAMLRYNLMDIRIFFRRAALLIGVYALLLVSVAPLIFSSPNLSSTLVIAGVLSVGPFIYAYLLRRSVFFHEHTMAGITHELKSPLAAIESALAFLQEKNDIGSMSKEQMRSITNLQEPAIRVRCDRLKISLALSNLVNNAIKFSDGGRVTIETKKNNDGFAISVTDTGCGIAANELPLVFDRFYQATAGRSKKGSGLGLSIAKIWIEAHGGKIWAESEGEGKGTKVTFTLPAI